MNDDHERRVDVVGQTLEKHLQRMDPARGCSDSNGGESLGVSLFGSRLSLLGRLIVVVHWKAFLR
jgi:hypothetical protein